MVHSTCKDTGKAQVKFIQAFMIPVPSYVGVCEIVMKLLLFVFLWLVICWYLGDLSGRLNRNQFQGTSQT